MLEASKSISINSFGEKSYLASQLGVPSYGQEDHWGTGPTTEKICRAKRKHYWAASMEVKICTRHQDVSKRCMVQCLTSLAKCNGTPGAPGKGKERLECMDEMPIIGVLKIFVPCHSCKELLRITSFLSKSLLPKPLIGANFLILTPHWHGQACFDGSVGERRPLYSKEMAIPPPHLKR